MARLNIQYPNAGRALATHNVLKRQQFENDERQRTVDFRNALGDSGYFPGDPGAMNALKGLSGQYPERAIPLAENEQNRMSEQQQQQIGLLKEASEAQIKALYAKSDEEARLLLDSNPFTRGVQIERIGPDVKMTKGDMSISGSAEKVATFLEIQGALADQIVANPAVKDQLYASALRNGVSIEEVQDGGDETKHGYTMEEIRERGRQARLTVKEKDKLERDKPKDVQARIDRLNKEIPRLATVRQNIIKGDKFDQLIKIMGKDQFAAAGLTVDDSKDEALEKIDRYEQWVRKELRKLELGGNGAEEDPLNMFDTD